MFLHEGSVVNNLKLSTPSEVSEVEVAAVGCCTLVAIVVAGGGFGSPQSGGGSGYVESEKISLAGHFFLTAQVGAAGQLSAVTWGGREVVWAKPGGDAQGFDGGDGYSGGGASESEGGADGSDGVSGSKGEGGRGSGLSLGNIQPEHFALMPGAGGVPHNEAGGGGGGVLVDDEGPGQPGENIGEGYGGGGSEGGPGQQGIVMVSYE